MNSSAIFFFLTGIFCSQFSFGMEAVSPNPGYAVVFTKENVSNNRQKHLGPFKALYDLLPRRGKESESFKNKIMESVDPNVRVTRALVNCFSGFACLYEIMPTRLQQSNRAESFTKAVKLLNKLKYEQAIKFLKKAYRPIKTAKQKLYFGLAGALLCDLRILKGEYETAYTDLVAALNRHKFDPYPVYGYLTQSIMSLAYRSYHLSSQNYLRNNNHLIVSLREEKNAHEKRVKNKKIKKVIELLSDLKLKEDSSGIYNYVGLVATSDNIEKNRQSSRIEYFEHIKKNLSSWSKEAPHQF